jgi:hypothetical protein
VTRYGRYNKRAREVPLQGSFFSGGVSRHKKAWNGPILTLKGIFTRLIILEWSSHDVYDHQGSLVSQAGANCYRWEFANWRKILQIDGFVKHGQEFPNKNFPS